jgi:hypothetical protein
METGTTMKLKSINARLSTILNWYNLKTMAVTMAGKPTFMMDLTIDRFMVTG